MNLDPPPLNEGPTGKDQWSVGWKRSIDQLYKYVRQIASGGGTGTVSITQPAKGLAVTPNATPSAAFTFALADDIAAIQGVGTAPALGYLKKTAAGVWAAINKIPLGTDVSGILPAANGGFAISVNAQTGTTYTYAATDVNKLVTHSNASAIAGTLPVATTSGFGVGFFMWVQNTGAGTLTITPTTSTIDGATSLALTTGQGCFVTSDGANYFTERGVGGSGGGGGGGASGVGMTGRVTLTTGVPVTTSDVIGATTLYWCPYKGNQVTLWNGTAWTAYFSAQISLSLGTLTAAIGYDLFMYQSGGTPSLEILAWTNATTRATAVTYQDGRLCKSTDKTRLLIASFYTTSTTTTADSVLQRFVWNAYNQEPRDMRVTDATASWTPPSPNVWRQSDGSTSNKVEVFSGQPQSLEATALSIASGPTGQNAASGIGIDSTTVNSAQLSGGGLFVSTALQYSSYCKTTLTVGYHAINWLEITTQVTGGNMFFYGSGTLSFFNNGLVARVFA